VSQQKALAAAHGAASVQRAELEVAGANLLRESEEASEAKRALQKEAREAELAAMVLRGDIVLHRDVSRTVYLAERRCLDLENKLEVSDRYLNAGNCSTLRPGRAAVTTCMQGTAVH
jgi:hypothetical protein